MPSLTIRDVAREAGVSISSVSRILRGESQYRYHEDTERRVREAAERLGYQAHAAARLLRQQETKLIGLAVHVTVRPHFNHLVVAVHDELIAHGYAPMLFEPNQLLPAHSHAPFPSLAMLAGIVSIDMTMPQSVPNFHETLASRLPTVALYPVPDDSVDFVFTDLAAGVEMAVEHLVELGHRRIAFTTNFDGPHPSPHLKTSGWKRATARHELVQPENYFIRLDQYGAIPDMAEEIAQRFLQLSPRPTALVCPSDEVAMCVINQLMSRGVQVPRDVSVVGFDGIEVGAYTCPALTTIVQPVDAVAGKAVERLMQVIRGNNGVGRPPLREYVKPQLCVRASTAAPPAWT